MPITFGKKPATKSKSKTVTPKGKAASKSASSRSSRKHEPASAPLAGPGWWDSLTAERKLDVAGVIMALIGALILLSLFTVNRSAITGGFIKILSQFFGWGL